MSIPVSQHPTLMIEMNLDELDEFSISLIWAWDIARYSSISVVSGGSIPSGRSGHFSTLLLGDGIHQAIRPKVTHWQPQHAVESACQPRTVEARSSWALQSNRLADKHDIFKPPGSHDYRQKSDSIYSFV